MNKRIGLAGLKGTGKDFVASILQDEYSFKPFAIADLVKVEFARNLGFLEKEDEIIKKDLWKYLPLIGEESNNTFPLDLLWKKTEELSDEEVLFKINTYKNIDSLNTRKELYNYFDIEKKDWYPHVSNLAVKEIKKIKGNVVITDVRTLLEAVDLLLNDWLLINLYNSRSNDIEENIEFFHFSEFELPVKINDRRIGLSIDITSRDKSYLVKKIKFFIDNFYKDFKGYSKDFKESLLILREEIIREIPPLEKGMADSYKGKELTRYKGYKIEIEDFKSSLEIMIKREYSKIFIF